MRTQLLGLALVAAMVHAPRLHGQSIGMPVGHNSAKAVSLVMANAAGLKLTPAQIARLQELQAAFDRRETRRVRVGWIGTGGRGGMAAYRTVRVAPDPDLYTRTETRTRLVASDRVPGKSVPRLQQTRIIRLIQQPCPFTFLAASQLEKAHELFVQR